MNEGGQLTFVSRGCNFDLSISTLNVNVVAVSLAEGILHVTGVVVQCCVSRRMVCILNSIGK